jgi:hypothetical protein
LVGQEKITFCFESILMAPLLLSSATTERGNNRHRIYNEIVIIETLLGTMMFPFDERIGRPITGVPLCSEQVPAGQVSARGDAPGGFSLDASVMTWVRPGSLCISAMVLPDSRDLMHGRTGGSLRIGSLRRKILGTGEKRKGRRGPRKYSVDISPPHVPKEPRNVSVE